jgi:hypothetical protein
MHDRRHLEQPPPFSAALRPPSFTLARLLFRTCAMCASPKDASEVYPPHKPGLATLTAPNKKGSGTS